MGRPLLEARAERPPVRTVGDATSLIRRVFPVFAESAVPVNAETIPSLIAGQEPVQLAVPRKLGLILVKIPETVYKLPEIISHNGTIKLGAWVSQNGSSVTGEYYLKRSKVLPVIEFGRGLDITWPRTIWYTDQTGDHLGVEYEDYRSREERPYLRGGYPPMHTTSGRHVTELAKVVAGFQSFDK